jgi:hypothetical protein
MVRKLPNFTPALFEALMGFLLDIEDDPDWHKVCARGQGACKQRRVACCINGTHPAPHAMPLQPRTAHSHTHPPTHLSGRQRCARGGRQRGAV